METILINASIKNLKMSKGIFIFQKKDIWKKGNSEDVQNDEPIHYS